MPEIDINTLFFVVALVSAVMAMTLMLIGSDLERSTLIWSLAYLSHGVAFLLIALRSAIPEAVSIWQGNFLVSLTYSLFALALLKFLHIKAVPWMVYLPPLMIAFSFPLLLDNLANRVILAGSINSAQLFYLFAIMWREERVPVGRGRSLLLVCFAAGGLISLQRPIATLAGFDGIASFDSGGALQVYTFMGITILLIMIALGVILMIKEQAEAVMNTIAGVDALTGLPNRRGLYERIKEVNIPRKADPFAAIILLDLDNFKTANDLYGHAEGDQILSQAAQRMLACVGEDQMVARLGGDEFVVLLPDLGSDRSAAEKTVAGVVEKLSEALSQDFHLQGLSLEEHELAQVSHVCGATFGVKVFQGGRQSREELLREADMAMYAVKNQKKTAVLGA